MKNRWPHNPFTVYTDAFMCLMIFFVLIICLLLISMRMQTVVKHEGIKPKAEFLVTLTWDDKRDVDLDLWLRDPMGNVVWYGGREDTNISLDRDSRGFITNQTILPNGAIVYSGNREVITIRAIIPGDYLVAVNYFGFSAGDDGRGDHAIDANVQVEKVNPDLTQVAGANLHLNNVRETQNAVAFHVNDDGSVEVLPTPPVDLISQSERNGGGDGNVQQDSPP